MTDPQFTKELKARGFAVLIPGRDDVPTHGYIDLGDGHRVNRWLGGSRLEEQLAFCVKVREGLAKAKAKVAAKPAPKVAKKVAKKAAKKVAKKGGAR
jgi:hypothetical protein